MEKLPDEKEVKNVVFSLNKNSVGGSDGSTGAFYQVCWDIFGDDIVRLVKAFFCG